MFIAAAVALSLNLGSLLGHRSQPITAPQPEAHCHIRVVSHKFVGQPGMLIKYAGEIYSLPGNGTLELIADKGVDTYEYNGRALPLNVFPLDQFGTETVHIPAQVASAQPASQSALAIATADAR